MTVAEAIARLTVLPADSPLVVSRPDGFHFDDILDIVAVTGWPTGVDLLQPMVMVKLQGSAK
jgi:hypothetical protein